MCDAVRRLPVAANPVTRRRVVFVVPNVLASLLLIAFATLAFGTAHAQNRVVNPGFEYGTSPWYPSGGLTASGVNPHSGTGCGSVQLQAYGHMGQELTGRLNAGETYNWSAWLRTTTGAAFPKIAVMLDWADSGGGGSTTLLALTPLPTIWSQYSGTFTLNVTGTLTYARIRFNTERNALPLLLDDVSVTGGSPLDAPGPGEAAFALDAVWPNPSRGDRLALSFALPTSDPARIELLDVGGRRVAGREVGFLGAGRHTVDLADGRRVPAGLYFVRLSQGANSRTVRVAVLL